MFDLLRKTFDSGRRNGTYLYRGCSNGDLLAITDAEFNRTSDPSGMQFSLGIGYSADGGLQVTYCGEIVRPADDRQNGGGGACVIYDGYLQVYFNEVIPGVPPTQENRIQCAARAPLEEALRAASHHEITRQNKYRAGRWNFPGLGGEPGDDLIPRGVGGEDLHADDAYCSALERFLLTVQTYGNGKLLLFSPADGGDGKVETVLDEAGGNLLQPCSAFVDFDGPSDDGHLVDEDFHIYFPRKGPDSDRDDMYRVHIRIDE